MKLRLTIMILAMCLTLSPCAAFLQELKHDFSEMAKYYYPTAGNLFNTEEMSGYHKSVIDKMVQQKEDGLTLLYNILYSNLTLSLMRDCLINFTNDDCELFEKYMHSVLDKAIKGDSKESEEKLKLFPQDLAKAKDYFNIALLFDVFTSPVEFTEENLSQEQIRFFTELNSFLEEFNDMIFEDEERKLKYQTLLNNAAKQLKEMSDTINIDLQEQLEQDEPVNNEQIYE